MIAVPAMKLRRLSDMVTGGFPLRRLCPIEARTANRHAGSCVFVHRAHEPKRNACLLNCVSKPRRGTASRAKRGTLKRWVAMGRVLDRVGQLIARYLERPVAGYEPFTPSDPNALAASLRPGDVLLVE